MTTVCVKHCGQTLTQVQEKETYVAQALQARQQALAGGEAIDGPDFARHLKARVRGKASTCPAPRPMAELLARKA